MWQRIKEFFKHSETIFLARLQVVLGVIAVLVTYVDPHMISAVLPGGWAPWFILAHGFALEYLRRRRAKDLK